MMIDRINDEMVELSQLDSIKLMDNKFKEEIGKMRVFKSPAASSNVVMHPKNEEEKN